MASAPLARAAAESGWRPIFHYAPARNWLSDPNGLVWFEGEYHLFYQYNPHGTAWGHMSWGHAVSHDLVAWEELPLAIAEDAQHMIFSGSAVIDHHNSAGLTDGATPPMVAFYTGAGHGEGGNQVQCLAYSPNRGRTWVKYAENPVLDLRRNDFRDPKVFWHAMSNAWVMLAVLADESRAVLFRSTNLIDWTQAGGIGPFALPGRVWECPDLMELPVEGGDSRWFFKADLLHPDDPARNGAFGISGSFDGFDFTPDLCADGGGWQWIDHGQDFYAAVGWNGVETPVWIGWLGNHRYQGLLPETGWRGAMSLARRLSLRARADGFSLVQRPVVPHAHILWEIAHRIVAGETILVADNLARAFHLHLMDVSGTVRLGFTAGAGMITLEIDAKRGRIALNRSDSGTLADPVYGPQMTAQTESSGIRAPVDLWFDDHCVEIFADDGALVLSAQHFLVPGAITLSVTAGVQGGAFAARISQVAS
jgi:fructan beta-fructosidase